MGSIPAGVLEPVAIRVHEELSRPYCIEVALRCDVGRARADALLREPAEIVIYSEYTGKVVRRFGGTVHRATETLRRSATTQRIELEIVPALTWLQYSRDSRIFQNLTTQGIVKEVFKQRGINESNVEWRLDESYKPRETCTQLDETCLDFVSRLLEEDGIFYFHEHAEDGTKLILADSAGKYSTHPAGSLRYKPESGQLSEEAISEVSLVDALRPARVELRDHDFKKPALQPKATDHEASPFDRELYEYPARFVDDATGKRFARARIGEERTAVEGLRGKAHAFSMAPGFSFELEDAPHKDAAGNWVPTRVEHHWGIAERGGVRYETTFTAINATLTYRPRRVTPQARARGPHLAIVAGPKGEEIHCDEFGRVKVQFLWDRYGKQDDKSSGWIRVSQMQSSGSAAIPRIGWEVLVEFEDGDPEKPIIVGRLYNGTQMPPVSLPAGKTITNMQSFSSPGAAGHNEIRINDGAGGELISVHAQKDMNVVVANNRKAHVTNNSTVAVGANQTLSVGAMRTEQVGANDETIVDGDQTWKVGAIRTETVTGTEHVDIKGTRTVTIGATHTVMTPKAISISTSGNLSETVGGACLEVAGMSVSTAVAGSYSATVGGAKIEAVAAGRTEMTVGARTVTVGGAFINAAGGDIGFNSKGSKSINVGGVYMASGGQNAELSAATDLEIQIGAALAVNGATIVLKVGGSSVTLSAGSAVLKSKEITLNASGPNAELAPMVGSK